MSSGGGNRFRRARQRSASVPRPSTACSPTRSLFAARAAVEVTVLVVGWLLGGSVGVATVVFALAIGPLVHRAMPRLTLPPEPST